MFICIYICIYMYKMIILFPELYERKTARRSQIYPIILILPGFPEKTASVATLGARHASPLHVPRLSLCFGTWSRNGFVHRENCPQFDGNSSSRFFSSVKLQSTNPINLLIPHSSDDFKRCLSFSHEAARGIVFPGAMPAMRPPLLPDPMKVDTLGFCGV